MQPGHLVGQAGIAHGLRHEPAEFGALLGSQGVHQPLGGGGPPGQRVDQLGEILRVVREELAVLVHEFVELLLRVLAARVGVKHLVERLHHLADVLHVLRSRVGQRVTHAGELRVEDLRPQQILNLLVLLPSLGRTPLVVGEFAHGPGSVAGQRVEFGLGHARRVGRIGEQRPAFGLDRLVEQFADLLQRAVELATAAQFARTVAGPAAHCVEPVAAAAAPAQQAIEGVARRHPGEDVLADLVESVADVVRRFQGIRSPVPGPVPRTRHRKPFGCRSSPLPVAC